MNVYYFLKLKFLQVREIKLIQGKTFPFTGAIEVTAKDLLLVRMKEDSKYWIRVLHRLTGDLINEIPSMCDHDRVRLNKHPRHPDHLLESCATCKEVQALNINTEERVIVYKGSEIIIMCAGPARSLLVVDKDSELSKLDWGQDQSPTAQMINKRTIPSVKQNKQFLRFCYVECHDIFMCTMKDKEEDQDYEILAVKLGSGTIAWRMFGPLDSAVFKPESITCDSDGNAYVNDRGNSRILKINSLTGKILSILLFEDDERRIRSMRWSNTEPNLTLRGGSDQHLLCAQVMDSRTI